MNRRTFLKAFASAAVGTAVIAAAPPGLAVVAPPAPIVLNRFADLAKVNKMAEEIHLAYLKAMFGNSPFWKQKMALEEAKRVKWKVAA